MRPIVSAQFSRIIECGIQLGQQFGTDIDGLNDLNQSRYLLSTSLQPLFEPVQHNGPISNLHQAFQLQHDTSGRLVNQILGISEPR